MTLQYYDPEQPLQITYGNLPHWFQERSVSFVTYRLDDSIPRQRAIEYKRMYAEFLERNPKPWSKQTYAEFRKRGYDAIEKWLHQGTGSCALRRQDVRQIVIDSFRYLDGDYFQIFAYVIMPNHVHLLVAPYADLRETLKSHKRFTATQINRLLKSSGHLWQRESHDHVVRGMNSFVRLLYYIRDNPKFLPTTDYTLYFAEGFHPDLLIGTKNG